MTFYREVAIRASRLGYNAGATQQLAIGDAMELARAGDLDGATTLLDEVELALHPALAVGGGGGEGGGVSVVALHAVNDGESYYPATLAQGTNYFDLGPGSTGTSWVFDRNDLDLEIDEGTGALTLQAGFYLTGAAMHISQFGTGFLTCYLLTDTPNPIVYPRGDEGLDAGAFADVTYIINLITAPTSLIQVGEGDGIQFRVQNQASEDQQWQSASIWLAKL